MRGDALRGEGNFDQPMWKFLGISQFWFISNKSRTKNIPSVCPIERGAIGKASGIIVSVKFSTVVGSLNQSNINNEFHCSLTNVNNQSTGAHHSSTSDQNDLRDVNPGVANTLTLSLPNSNRVSPLGSSDGGGYMLPCSLPRVRQEPGSQREFDTRLIHYSVKERD